MATTQKTFQRKHPLAMCEMCPLKDQPCAPSSGPKDAAIAVVSRSPGHYEALNGKVFSGPSGKVLDHLLKMQGLERDQVLATNVVLCQVPETLQSQDSAVPEQAVIACSARLESEIQTAGTVIAAGAEAARALLGDHVRVGLDRGYVHYRDNDIQSNKQRVIVTNNPAMVLRDDRSFPELVRDFRLAINPLPKPKLPDVNWIEDIKQAKQAVDKMVPLIKQADLVSTDIEARGVDGESGLSKNARIVCAGFATRPERALVFGERPCYDDVFRREYLPRLYGIDGVRYLWHNGKYDVKILRATYGIQARVDEDSMLLSWCLDERPGNPESGAGGHSLEWLLKDELGWPKYEPDSVKIFKKTGDLPSDATRRDLYRYNGFDTAGTLALFNILAERAKYDNVWDKPYRFMLIRLSEALTRTELSGNIFDADVASDILEEQVWPKLAELKYEMREIAMMSNLNPNSPKQLESLLYDEWGIKHNLMRPKIERFGKRSTDKSVREEILRGDYTYGSLAIPAKPDEDPTARTIHIFTQKLDTFKELDKQRGTYLEGLIKKRDKDGRIYTDFKISGTESGRLSSSNPNMQNVTRPKEGLPNIRAAFVADPGCSYVSADLSQAELRIIAVLSGSTNLQSIYLDTNRSLHKETATEFYGEGYSYEQYVRSKNINFGVVYWQSAFSFAQMYHMPREEADKYIKWWFNRFDGVWDWTKEMERKVIEDGEIQSPFGHKRRFYVIPSDQSGRLHVVKEGINFLPQSIAANITLWAFCNISEQIDWEVTQLRINVHDNIVACTPNKLVPETAALIKYEMEHAAKEAIGWDFPFKADVSVGPNWGSLEEYHVG